MEHLYPITRRNVTDFISLSSLSPHVKMLSDLNSTVPFQTVQGRKTEGDLDSPCLILGIKWTLGFHGYFNQGGSQHDY